MMAPSGGLSACGTSGGSGVSAPTLQGTHGRLLGLGGVVPSEARGLAVGRDVIVHRDVGVGWSEVRRVERADVARPRDRQVGTRYVVPGLAFVPRQLDHAVVGLDSNP